ncbi:MAG: ATP-dependent RNA helicase HrpA [Opitutales bacterium]
MPTRVLKERIESCREDLADCPVQERLALAPVLKRLWPPRHEGAVIRTLERVEFRIEHARQRTKKRREAGIRDLSFDPDLPITAHREAIIASLRKEPVLVLAGETGSGKSTQLPKLCLEAGFGVAGRIGCTQPRRLAALSVSRRVAEECRATWGREIGCQVRFTDKTGRDTQVKFMTDGILLQELQADPDLPDYDCLIIDEAHERSLNIDFILGALRQIRSRRPDLRIVITSATIDTKLFADAFGGAPVLEVSGRTYPVTIRYRAADEEPGEDGEVSLLRTAADTIEGVIHSEPPGDVLVFLPGERDIRDLREMLEARRLPHCRLLPLMGRLSNAEQQAIFASCPNRKIILATNIAETSITVPGIRYVVDTGLARISRYAPHTRTLRLPIEPIARANADQRAGRAGRVAEGICIRLYSEEDYTSRPKFAEPEIRRSNLASVILTLKAAGLGDPETFPFIEPPDGKALRGGFRLLHDLGALDADDALTDLGRRIARLPVDPTIARMLFQADREGVLREVIIIAAALSIQDPRERPMDNRDAADRAHRAFADSTSDFLTLLNLWEAYGEATGAQGQSARRRFCKQHFLSYLRMREWADIQNQLSGLLQEMGLKVPPHPASDRHEDGIHRAILAGSLGNVASKDAGNRYRATHSRTVLLHPGSALFDRKAAQAARQRKAGNKADDNRIEGKTPDWIVCGEWLETRQLYAVTAAAIDPAWILELGAHLIQRSIDAPFWDPKAGRVLVRERQRIYGLLVAAGNVGYGAWDREAANELFIQQALVDDTIVDRIPELEHNRKVRAEVEEELARQRTAASWSLDDRLAAFYRERIPEVWDVPGLRQAIRAGHERDPAFLKITREDLLGKGSDFSDTDRFPRAVTIGGKQFSVAYAYLPGQAEDGATIRVPLDAMDGIEAGHLDWAIPGYLDDRIEALLRGLPKQFRRDLFPINEAAERVKAHLTGGSEPLLDQIHRVVRDHLGLLVGPDDWRPDNVPEHLRPRVSVVNPKGREILAGRDWDWVRAEIRKQLEAAGRPEPGAARQLWARAVRTFEKRGLTDWTFGDPDFPVMVGHAGNIPLAGWPGLAPDPEQGGARLRLYPKKEDAERYTPAGWLALAEAVHARELAWTRKDLKVLQELGADLALIGGREAAEEPALRSLLRHLFLDRATGPLLPLRESVFRATGEQALPELRKAPYVLKDRLAAIFAERAACLAVSEPPQFLMGAVRQLVPEDLLRRTPWDRLADIPRYLKAAQIRARRARTDPQKDRAKAERVRPFQQALADAVQRAAEDRTRLPAVNRAFWLLEEFKVAVYAPELGTRDKVSEKVLEHTFNALDQKPR